MKNVSLIKFLDRSINAALCLILSPFSRKKEINPERSKKVLFIQLWSIGETILTLPSIYSVKKKFSDSQVYVLGTERNREVLLSADFDLNVLTVKMNPFSIIRFLIHSFRKYDIVIDLEEYLNISALMAFFLGKQRLGFAGKLRSSLYNSTVKYDDKQHVTKTFLSLAERIGAEYKEEHLIPLRYGKNEEKKVKEILSNIPKKTKIVGIAPGAAESARSRMWPLENYVRLCSILIEKHDSHIILIGSEEEKSITAEILKNTEAKDSITDTAGLLSVKELFCLIKSIDILITNDTGPLHIASAQRTRTIALFGPNTPIRFGPYEKGSIALYNRKACEYSPCINVHLGRVPDCLYPRKSEDYQKCMKAIKVEDVLEAVEKIL